MRQNKRWGRPIVNRADAPFFHYPLVEGEEDDKELSMQQRGAEDITTTRRQEGRELLDTQEVDTKVIPLRLNHCFVQCSNTAKNRNKCGCYKQKKFKTLRMDMNQASKIDTQ